MSRETLRGWIRKADRDEGRDEGRERSDAGHLDADERAELARLRREKRDWQEEREILKRGPSAQSVGGSCRGSSGQRRAQAAVGQHREPYERFDGSEAEGPSHDQPELAVHAFHARVRQAVGDRGVDADLVRTDGARQLDERGDLRPWRPRQPALEQRHRLPRCALDVLLLTVGGGCMCGVCTAYLGASPAAGDHADRAPGSSKCQPPGGNPGGVRGRERSPAEGSWPMTASQEHISPATPMGATVVEGGATFRVWAPGVRSVHVAFGGIKGYVPSPGDALVEDPASHHWTGYFPGVVDGTNYRFWVVGEGNAGPKRDPWARELEFGDFHDTDCLVRARDSYPWHDTDFVPPAFNDLIVYQLHVGVFSASDEAGHDRRPGRVAKFLDALERVEYLADLGVNAIQPLPFVEFRTPWSLGYNGTDIFSPEMDYCVGAGGLAVYVDRVNRLLAKKGRAPLTVEQLTGQVNQLKAFVDVCHLYGLAVLPDVVYNHAGGDLDDQSLDFFNRPAHHGAGDSIYFSTAREAGGKVFDYAAPDVREFLIGNAKMFFDEYHVDGFRFDQVTVIAENGGWYFCQDLTNTLRYHKPSAALIAEYWGEHRWKAVSSPVDNAGMGFDLGYADELRAAVREVLRQAAAGGHASVDVGRLRAGLHRPANVNEAWRVYNCIENHDLLLDMDGDHRYPRIAQLAHWDHSRSWLARSRSRVATGVLLTAPGVPMLFMGQEFLADRWWSDDPNRPELLVRWADLEGGDRHASDFHRFARDLLWLRRRHPALRSDPVNVYHVDDHNRVLAFHRWVPGAGRDVVVVVSLHEQTFSDRSYQIGFPGSGHWHEVFNSDVYDHFVNPWAQGNPSRLAADGAPMHGLGASARITIPANSILVFARDLGD